MDFVSLQSPIMFGAAAITAIEIAYGRDTRFFHSSAVKFSFIPIPSYCESWGIKGFCSVRVPGYNRLPDACSPQRTAR
jgi:hypothetical protein